MTGWCCQEAAKPSSKMNEADRSSSSAAVVVGGFESHPQLIPLPGPSLDAGSTLSTSTTLSIPVTLRICLFICLSVCLPVPLSVCLFICLFVCSSVCLFICLSLCVCVCLSVCLPVCSSVCLLNVFHLSCIQPHTIQCDTIEVFNVYWKSWVWST